MHDRLCHKSYLKKYSLFKTAVHHIPARLIPGVGWWSEQKRRQRVIWSIRHDRVTKKVAKNTVFFKTAVCRTLLKSIPGVGWWPRTRFGCSRRIRLMYSRRTRLMYSMCTRLVCSMCTRLWNSTCLLLGGRTSTSLGIIVGRTDCGRSCFN